MDKVRNMSVKLLFSENDCRRARTQYEFKICSFELKITIEVKNGRGMNEQLKQETIIYDSMASTLNKQKK